MCSRYDIVSTSKNLVVPLSSTGITERALKWSTSRSLVKSSKSPVMSTHHVGVEYLLEERFEFGYIAINLY